MRHDYPKCDMKPFILPTEERAKHDKLETQDWREAGIEAGQLRMRVKWEMTDALFFYRNAGHLGRGNEAETRWGAGMRLRMDYQACGRDKRIIAIYGEFIGGKNAFGVESAWNDIRKAAEKRYGKAAAALGQAGLLALIISVACEGNKAGRGKLGEVCRGLDIVAKCY